MLREKIRLCIAEITRGGTDTRVNEIRAVKCVPGCLFFRFRFRVNPV